VLGGVDERVGGRRRRSSGGPRRTTELGGSRRGRGSARRGLAAVTGSDAAETDQALDPTSVEAAIDAHGVVHLSSGGRASDLLRGRVLIEMYNAQLIGTWRRLKVCHNARCHEVFFDQPKNNSRTWFDTAACANALNLRAYRERRKAARFSDLSERDPG
jgi:hypothetical protein